MTRSPRDVYAHLRAKARIEAEREEGSGPRPVTLDEKLRWMASETLRPPAPGHVDIVKLGRRRR